jgi:hypothetical protein
MTKQYDFKKINSITKYPSILTYHQLGQKGRLEKDLIESSTFAAHETVNIYEKIDGENSRIIFLCEGNDVDYLIGSREDLLFAKGDRIGNPSGNIANYFIPIANKMSEEFKGLHGLIVTYFESYGGKTPKSKQYSIDKTQNGRLFDAFALDTLQLEELLNFSLDKIASWRDHGGQPYFDCQTRQEFSNKHNLQTSPLLMTLKGSEMPTSLEDTNEWLQQFKETKVGINAIGQSEGVVVRTPNRKKITKIRMEDYARTLKVK